MTRCYSEKDGNLSRLGEDPLLCDLKISTDRRVILARRAVDSGNNNLGMLYYAQGEYAKAEPLHQRTLEIREKALGPVHLDVASSLNNLALLAVKQGHYAKAEAHFERALAIQETLLGPDHAHVANSFNNLALLAFTQGQVVI
jgi:tetratricopeptide (TPR) repeat protein